MRETKKTVFSLKLLPYDLSRLLIYCSNVWFRVRRVSVKGGAYREKPEGGAIFAMNHTGFSDPFVAANCFPRRRMCFLASEQVMAGKLRGVLLRGTGCIRIDRNGSDLEAVKRCVEVLRQGRLLTVFPQGALTDEAETLRLKSGAVLMALQAQVPIIPAYSPKRKRWYRPKTVVIGEPIHCGDYITKKIPSMKELNRVLEVLQSAMEECKKKWEEQHDNAGTADQSLHAGV